MEISQHYYTSFINRERGNAGFQVKAMSPAISPDTQNMILRLIAYRIPSSLDERAFKTHPRALRYYLFNEREALLISSRSNGNDPNGRPGNFFAHTLVVDPQIFTTVPPILYWESAFWCQEDTETRTTLQTLPDLPGDPELDIDAMWTFLQEGKRRAHFYKLLCAVIHGAGKQRRRIIIIDSDEHVAFWIAAVSCMLPPAYRPLLSFTTYHHDPYQSQFFITGTPPSVDLRLASEDYKSYFILNMQENKVSNVEHSLYAELAYGYATPEQYDNEMLTFFSRYAHRFPNPTVIDEQLDSIVLYARIMKKESSLSFSANELQAVRQALPTFEQMKYYEAQDIKDLKLLDDFLRRFYQASNNYDAEQLRQRIGTLLKKHKVPTDEIFKQDLIMYTRQIFGNYTSDIGTNAVKGLERLLQEYGQEKFIDQVNQADYLSMLFKLIQNPQLPHLIRMWQAIGPYLQPNMTTRNIFAESIDAWSNYAIDGVKNKARDTKSLGTLFRTLQTAIAPQGPLWFASLVKNASSDELPVEAYHLNSFYCAFVSPLSLEQREPYRNALRPLFSNLIEDEFAHDLAQTDVLKMLPAIRKWVMYVQRTQFHEPEALVAQGLATLRNHYQTQPEQWIMIARECLIDPQLSPVLGQWKARLLETAFSSLLLSQFELEHLPLYRQYSNDESLSARNRTIINGFLAMYDRHLTSQLSEELSKYAFSLSREMYHLELSNFCNNFFTAQLSDKDHFHLLTAFFVRQHEDLFWQIYWEKLCVMPTDTVARLLAFWFSPHPIQLPHPYITQDFLLALQRNLLHWQKMPDFQKTLSQMVHDPWYLAIQDSILIRKNVLFTKGQDLMKQMQKRLPNQKPDDDAEEQEQRLQDAMRRLFAKGSIRDNHLSMLRPIWEAYTPVQFWEAYKERLIQILLSDDAEQVLELFSFWFDASFSFLASQPFIAQSFFIGLPQVFELACKENEGDLRKMAQKLSTHIERAPAAYRWYALIESFLPEQPTEQRSRKFKR
jgi:hypothetical protein